MADDQLAVVAHEPPQELHAAEEVLESAGREEQAHRADLARAVQRDGPRRHRALELGESPLGVVRGALGAVELGARALGGATRSLGFRAQELRAAIERVDRVQEPALIALVDPHPLAALRDGLPDPLQVARGLGARAGRDQAERRDAQVQRTTLHRRASDSSASAEPSRPSPVPPPHSQADSCRSKKRGATPPRTSSRPNSKPGSTSRKSA